MKKKKHNNGTHTIACSGCGRYEKEVSDNVVRYFCCNCFTNTPNYLRYKQGLEPLLPVSDVKRGDLVKDLFGNTVKITKKAYTFGENFYFYGYNIKDKTKDEFVIADYHILLKLPND